MITFEKKSGLAKISAVEKVDGVENVVQESEQILGELVSSEPMANVGVTIGFTKNLGNYNSLKASVSVHIPCKNTLDGLEECFKQAEDFANKKIEELSNNLEG